MGKIIGRINNVTSPWRSRGGVFRRRIHENLDRTFRHRCRDAMEGFGIWMLLGINEHEPTNRGRVFWLCRHHRHAMVGWIGVLRLPHAVADPRPQPTVAQQCVAFETRLGTARRRGVIVLCSPTGGPRPIGFPSGRRRPQDGAIAAANHTSVPKGRQFRRAGSGLPLRCKAKVGKLASWFPNKLA